MKYAFRITNQATGNWMLAHVEADNSEQAITQINARYGDAHCHIEYAGYVRALTCDQVTTEPNKLSTECTAALRRVQVRQAYPGAKVSPITPTTYRVTYYETMTGCIVPVKHIQDSFLVDLNGDTITRRPEPARKRLRHYSDTWKS